MKTKDRGLPAEQVTATHGARQKRRYQDSAGNNRGKAYPPLRGVSKPPHPLVLIEEDGLVFTVVPPAPATAADAFRTAFSTVWHQLPGWDRQRLLSYWREPGQEGRQSLIQLVQGVQATVGEVVNQLGRELNFSLSLLKQPDRLPGEIATVLAHVLHIASGEHWRLVQEVLERPLARWEREEGKRATGAAVKKKVAALAKEHLARLEERITERVEGWGIAPSTSPPR
jgi:hypothetical protein